MIALAAQPVRLPLVGIVFLAFVAFAGGYAAHIETASTQVVSVAPAVAPLVRTTTSPAQTADDCKSGKAYVTGDLVGDASPAAIYDAMCSTRTLSR